MRTSLAIAIALVLVGCTTGRVVTVPADRAAAYLDGIAKRQVDECGQTYGLIVQYKEAAIPVIVKALDLYSNPTNAPSQSCSILSGVVWTYRTHGDEFIGIVDQINAEAIKNPNPAISQCARAWIQWREEQLKQKAEPSVRGDGKPAPQP